MPIIKSKIENSLGAAQIAHTSNPNRSHCFPCLSNINTYLTPFMTFLTPFTKENQWNSLKVYVVKGQT